MTPRFTFVLAGFFCFLAQAAVPSLLLLETVDADTGKPVPSLIRVTDGEGRVIQLSSLLNRGIGLRKNHPHHNGIATMAGRR